MKCTKMFSGTIIIRRLIVIVFVISGIDSYSQDAALSYYQMNSMQVNPAFAGSKDVVRASFSNRLQWISTIKKFVTNSFAVDMGFNRLGVGIMASHNQETDLFSYYDAGGAISYTFGDLRRIIITPGVLFAYQHRNMNWDDFIFYDQLNPNNNEIAPYSEAMQEIPNINLFDMDAGILTQIPVNMWRSEPGWLNLGVAVHHIPEKNIAQLGVAENPYPRKYTFHGGFLVPLYLKDDTTKLHKRTKISLYPNFRYERQGEFNRLDISCIAFRKPFVAGISLCSFQDFYNFKNANHIAPMVGYEGKFGNWISYQFSYSIDWVYSGLRGKDYPSFISHELSLLFIFSPFRRKDCIEVLNYKGRWFDPEKNQRRFQNECPPPKTPRKTNNDILPTMYPFELPVY